MIPQLDAVFFVLPCNDLRIMGRAAAPSILVERSVCSARMGIARAAVYPQHDAYPRLAFIVACGRKASGNIRLLASAPDRYEQLARIHQLVVVMSAADWHANDQMCEPHLVSWQPIVPAPNSSVARGSTPRPLLLLVQSGLNSIMV
jgi:hypothetical protein